jgi:pSer/pThr/pTyr-binding forkhead associated (FHA) protein
MASIIVMNGPNEGDYYPLGHRTNVIGRDEALMIQILDDRVSRKHMKICYDKDEDKHYAVDMESRHGVLINGMKISDETVLNNEDCITIGKTSLLYVTKDFTDRESALSHFNKIGERIRPTLME